MLLLLRFMHYATENNLYYNRIYLLYFMLNLTYTVYSKVDSARKVSCLGKSMDERAHLLCGATV